MHAGGGFVSSTNFRSFKADMVIKKFENLNFFYLISLARAQYLSAEDMYRAVLEVIFLLGLLGWIGYTTRNLYQLKKHVCSKFDILVLL
jgi:hypothetical protein